MSQADEIKIAELFDAASEAWDDGDEGKALELFLRAAELGDVPAMLNVGFFHDEGIGVPVDKTTAMNWYRKAYDLGDGGAANNIAILHREQEDFAAAADWFGKAITLGDMDARVALAKMYIAGEGVEMSEDKARALLAVAVEAPVLSEDEDEDEVADLDYISEDGHDEAVALLAGLTR